MTSDKSTNCDVRGGNAPDSPRICLLSEAHKIVPTNAVYVSLRIKGVDIPIHKVEDVLIWVCKKMSLYKPTQLQSAMRLRQTSWLKPHRGGMMHPYRIAHNCYVNMDGSGTTPLLRAAKILEWLAWPRADASLTYREPPPKIVVHPAPVAPVAVEEISKPEEKPVAKKTARERIKEMMEKDLSQPDPEFDEMFKGVDFAQLMKDLEKPLSEILTVATAKSDASEAKDGDVRKFSYKFDNIESVTGTDPISLFIKGKEYPLERKWTNLPAKVCIALEGMWPGKVRELVAAGNVSCMATTARGMRRGQYVPEAKVWVEKNCASREFVRQTRNLCRLFGINLTDVSVTYVAKGMEPKDDSVEAAAEVATPPQTQTIDLEKLFADVPVPNLARLVIIETLKRGMDGNEAWNNLMNIPWCRQNLGLRNALLRKLKIWESAGEYAQTYIILDQLLYDKFLILKYPTGFKVSAFIEWAQGLGLPLGDICKLFEIEPPPEEAPAPVASDEGKTMVYPEVRESEPNAVHEPEADYDLDERGKTVRDYVAQHPGCAKQKAIDELSNMGISKVLTRLDRHPEVMEIEHRLYVKESIEDFDDAVTILQEALDSLFAANGGYTSAHELYQTVQLKLDDFFYGNDAFDSEGEVFDIAAYLFGKAGYKNRRHIFRGGTHIWREEPDYPMADHGLLIHWARLNGGILTRQIGYDNLERRGALGPGKSAIFTLAMQKVKDKFWALSGDDFLLKDGIEIGTEFLADVKRRLDELLSIEEQEDGVSFIPMGVVGDDFFASLPPLPGSRPWSIQLLQAVIADHSGKLHYKTIARSNFAGQSHAAIVPDGCECQDFSDLVYAVIKARNNKPSISFGRTQFVDFLKSTGLYPEDMSGSSIENMFDRNGHFKWLDKNNLVVS